MLARRLTIVCLLITIFGMSLAILVAEKSRPSYPVGMSCFAVGCSLTSPR